MSLVMSDNFVGSPGAAFAGDSTYSVVIGAPALAACSYGVAVRFPAAAQTIIAEAFAAATTRVFSRIYKINGTPTAASDVFNARTSTGIAAGGQVTSTGRLYIFNAGSAQTATSTAALPTSTEFRVVYTVTPTTFTAAIYPDTSSTTPTQTLSVPLSAPSLTLARDGLLTATGLGAGVTFDLIWPEDDDTSDPGLRIYVSCTLDVTSGFVPKTITATAAVQNAPAGTDQWTFHWDDGTADTVQSSNVATHTYTAPGTYSITVDLDVS